MLDKVLKNAMEGFTVIEEETGSVASILARQLGKYSRAAGKKVSFVRLTAEGPPTTARVVTTPGTVEMREGSGQAYSHSAYPPFLDGGNYDLLVVDSLSTYLFERTDKEGIETVSALSSMTRQGKSFIVTYDGALLGEKTAAFLRATADTVVIVKAELVGDRVNRLLYVPKLRDSAPMDRLIKITVDETGVQIDTREFVG